MPIAPPVTAYGNPQELWYWNSLALNSEYWNITTFGGSRSGIPTLRGQDYQVPYRAGQSWRAKYPDERTISLTMWLDGSASAHQSFPATDNRLAFNDNWQSLRANFFSRNLSGSVQGQLQRNWYWTQGGAATLVQSTAMAEIAGSMDLAMNGRTGGAFTVDLLLADPYFYGPTRTQTITGSGNITAYGEGVVGEGYPSAVNAFTITCSAPMTLTNVTQGVSLTLSSGPTYPVVVDILNYTVTDANSVSWPAALTHAGSRLWMGLASGLNAITASTGNAIFSWNDAYI